MIDWNAVIVYVVACIVSGVVFVAPIWFIGWHDRKIQTLIEQTLIED